MVEPWKEDGTPEWKSDLDMGRSSKSYFHWVGIIALL